MTGDWVALFSSLLKLYLSHTAVLDLTKMTRSIVPALSYDACLDAQSGWRGKLGPVERSDSESAKQRGGSGDRACIVGGVPQSNDHVRRTAHAGGRLIRVITTVQDTQ